jgi:hypothetical protein
VGLIEDIQTLLKARPLIAAAVGTRVYWLKAPQGQAAPYLVYQHIAGQREDDLSNTIALAHPIWQIDGWSNNPADMSTLSAAIRSIKGFGGTAGGTTFQDVRLIGSRDIPEPPEAASDVAWQAVSFDFEFWYEEPVPS